MSDQQTPDEWAAEARQRSIDLIYAGEDDPEIAQLAQANALIQCARHLGNIERHLAKLVDRADLTKREW